MAIETAGQSGSVQTKLVKESREERLTRLFDLEMKIQEMRDAKDKLKAQYNAVNNDIKAHEKDKVELLNLINSGQGTFITVAAAEQEAPEDLDSDLPTDEQLEEFADKYADDPAVGEEEYPPEENQELAPGEGVEGGDAEPGEAYTEEVFEGDTENNDENMLEIPDIQPDHWVLTDSATLKVVGKEVTKKEPVIGGIYNLPLSLRQNGNLSYRVEGFSLVEEDDEAFHEVFVELMDEARRKEYFQGEPAQTFEAGE